MNDQQVFGLVEIEIVKYQDNPIKLKPGYLLKEDLGLASMNIVSLMTEMAFRLNLSILDFSAEDLVHLDSVQDIVSLFSKKINDPNSR